MAELIFDLQRFDSSGSGSGGGSSSGGSNAKTDGNATIAVAEVWKDSFQLGNYSSLSVNHFRNEANALRGLVTPSQYYSTTAADTIYVSGLDNNIIYDTDRFDNITFVDTNLEALADFDYTATDELGNGYYDMLFSNGTLTRIYTYDNQFSPYFAFASGLSEIYSPIAETWFTPQELQSSLDFWSSANWYVGTDYYVNSYGVVVDSSDDDAIEVDVYDLIPLSRAYNNLVTHVDWNDDIVLSDTRVYRNDISSINTSEAGTIGILYTNGTGTVVKYDGTFSPRFYLNDYNNAIVYNSTMGAWRTYEQALTDSVQYETEANQAALEKAAYEANFNSVIDVSEYYDPAFPVSRFENTLIYSGNSNTDLYLFDSAYGNILGILPTDDYHIDVYFDTGLIAEIEYTSVVSPTLHTADGTSVAYNWGTSTLVDSYSGTSHIEYDYDSEGNVIDSYRYFTENDVFAVSRAADSFINKVTSNDDILISDATYANIADITVIGGYAISMTFDTGANLRVQDVNYISPVFHFGDGTQMAYNWIDDQWAAAFDSTPEVYESFALSSENENFVRNADGLDVVCISDATVSDIVDVYVDTNYINLCFDTGTSTAVKYSDMSSPDFLFADGTRYFYQLTVDDDGYYTGSWQTYDANGYIVSADMAESADLLTDPADAFTTDATLTDLVAPVADVASFDAGKAFEINTAGGFVAPAAARVAHKTA